MKLKDLKEKFCLVQTDDKSKYMVYVNHEYIPEFYTKYHGSSNSPFLGYVSQKGTKIFWTPVFIDETKPECYEINSFDDIKSYMRIMTDNCEKYCVFTDCCDPMMKDSYKCSCALYSYVHKYLDIDKKYFFNSQTYTFDFFEIICSELFNEEKVKITIRFNDDSFVSKVFSNPYKMLCYISALIEIYSLEYIAKHLQAVTKIKRTSMCADYDLFSSDTIRTIDLETFNIRDVDTLKNSIIHELESKLQLLKGGV